MRRGQRKGDRPDPIARWSGDLLLMDTLAMTIHLEVSDRTVRRYPPIACDLATRAPLWDALAVGDARRGVRARPSVTRRPYPVA